MIIKTKLTTTNDGDLIALANGEMLIVENAAAHVERDIRWLFQAAAHGGRETVRELPVYATALAKVRDAAI